MSADPAPRPWAELESLHLGSVEVDLWLTAYDELSEGLHTAYRELLSDAERLREPRFHFAHDRVRYLVTRALVRTVLSRYVALDPRAWRFSANAHGRPEVANPEGRDQGLTFNLSHTHSLIALGVTRRRALGIDVESVRAPRAPVDLADHYFAPAEAAMLRAAPPSERPYRFFEYWTLKEAYIKARGLGLALPLDKFSFHYPRARAVEMEIAPELGDHPARWQLWQLRPAPGSPYLVAVCAERLDADVPHLTVRQAVPLVGETLVLPEVRRGSASSRSPAGRSPGPQVERPS